MRPIDVLIGGIERVICCWEVDGVLVDPGPQSTESTLLEALGGEAPRALLLTHIHFDHAGASGALVRRFPDLPVFVHTRGARHMAHPERLVASAAQLFGGEDGLRARWGEVVPVPEANITALEGGETILGDFRVAYTPGHAVHHVSYLHEPSGMALTGDAAGVRIPPGELVIAPSVPPDFDPVAWESTIDTLRGWEPTALGLTHFGQVDDVGPHLDRLQADLHHQLLLAARHGREAFEAAILARMEEEAGDMMPAYMSAIPPDHTWPGVDRYLRKRAGTG